jgi:hypothetical protein
MDCLYSRLDGEAEYIRRLWTLTASNPAPPKTEVSLELVCYDRPLVPYRWPTSGRPTAYPDSEFSRRGMARAESARTSLAKGWREICQVYSGGVPLD